MQRVVGRPDLGAGRGYPVFAAFLSTGQFMYLFSNMFARNRDFITVSIWN